MLLPTLVNFTSVHLKQGIDDLKKGSSRALFSFQVSRDEESREREREEGGRWRRRELLSSLLLLSLLMRDCKLSHVTLTRVPMSPSGVRATRKSARQESDSLA